MKLKDIKIGMNVWTMTGKWFVTDVGTRTFAAVKLTKGEPEAIGPPYSSIERVFDEYDMEGVLPTLKDLRTSFDGTEYLSHLYDDNGNFK